MHFRTIDSVDLKDKIVFIREDLNVPIQDGKITSDARLVASLKTIRYVLDQGAAVLLCSHLGRPEEGVFQSEYSLAPVSEWLSKALSKNVPLVGDWIDGVKVQSGEVKLLENCRFLIGEKKNDSELSKKMAKLCDVYVMDAFATAHRAAASTVGIAEYADVACAGFLLSEEMNALGKALVSPKSPILAIVGGSKVSTKLTVLNALLDKVDILITGGGITNTLLLSQGYNIGKSLVEEELVEDARSLIEKTKNQGKMLPLPVDVVVGKSFDLGAEATVKKIEDISDDDMIMDIGPETIKMYCHLIEKSNTVIWNGPVGVFEFPQFSAGTKSLAKAIAEGNSFSLAGGGDTVAAIEQFGVVNDISYISTAGGAFLEYLEGKTLPAIAMLEKRAI